MESHCSLSLMVWVCDHTTVGLGEAVNLYSKVLFSMCNLTSLLLRLIWNVSNICVPPLNHRELNHVISLTARHRRRPTRMLTYDVTVNTHFLCLQGDTGSIGLPGAAGQKGEKVWSWTWMEVFLLNFRSKHSGVNYVFLFRDLVACQVLMAYRATKETR